MDLQFCRQIYNNYKTIPHSPSTSQIKIWTTKTISIMFPQFTCEQLYTPNKIQNLISSQKKWLIQMLKIMKDQLRQPPQTIAEHFFNKIHIIQEQLKGDISAIMKNDSKAKSQLEVVKKFKNFYAISFYRLAHQLYELNIPIIPRVITESAHSISGIDIHPGAKIGKMIYISHKGEVVIGETTIIGNFVKIYQKVTIGSLSLPNQQLSEQKRHPTIQDNVIIDNGASIFGGKTTIGHHSIVGTDVWVTQSVPPYANIFKAPFRSKNRQLTSEISQSVGHLIGNTPLVQIKRIHTNPNVKIFAKIQGQNPGGSVKDRPAYNMILQALQRGQLKPGMKLVQPTSGNTGSALAMIAGLLKIQMVCVMPSNFTSERIRTMQAYGAKVILTPADEGIQGSIDYAHELVEKGGYMMLNQFDNPDNSTAHYNSTGPEIYRDTQGKITHFISSMGTTGTIMGTGQYLRQKNSNIEIIGVHPAQGSKIPGIGKWPIDKLPKICYMDKVDEIIDITQLQAQKMVLRLARQETIFTGVSSGANMCAALKVAQRLQKGYIVFIVCDRGDRYLSSGLFDEKPESS